MAKIISDAEFEDFKQVMTDAHDSFAQKEIIWQRSVSRLNRYGEDPTTNRLPRVIKVLLNYNYMRSWPITFTSETGELDRQSIQVLINKEYLRSLTPIDDEEPFLTDSEYINYHPDDDRFIIDGLVHKPMGDTAVSQSGPDDMWFSIIIKREEILTGENRS